MDNASEHPVEILWRMQREAMASGNALPEERQDEPRWGGLAFGVGELRMVTELTSVIDVLACPPVTPVPGTRPWLRGICNVRGSIYSVVDLGVFLGVSDPLPVGEGRLLVINDKELGCTLLVSRIFGLRYFIEEQQRQDILVLEPVLRPFSEQAFQEGDEVWAAMDLGRLVSADGFMNVGGAAQDAVT